MGGGVRSWGGVRVAGAIIGTILLLLFSETCSAVQPHGGGKIATLVLGDVIQQHGGENSFIIIGIDPGISATLVPSRSDYVRGGISEVWRLMRVYLPRTYEQLIENYDVIMTSDTDRTVFKPEWIDWMADSVPDDGMGLFWIGFIASLNLPSWEETTIGDVLPSKPGDKFSISGAFFLRVFDRAEPLMNSIPWEESPPLMVLNTQSPKDGSEVWARVDRPEAYPLMTYWDVGEGAALCFAGHFPDGARRWADEWELFPLAMIFQVYRVAGKKIPEDPALFSVLLGEFRQSDQMNSLLMSMLAWVEKFGGSTHELHQALGFLRQTRHEADAAYMAGEWQRALEIMDTIRNEQVSIRSRAMKAKDQALVWIYTIEWCSLLATFMVSSAVVWNLMVRRRLYREVGLSRLASKGG